MGGAEEGDDIVRFALTLLDHVKTTRLSKEVGGASEYVTHGSMFLSSIHINEAPGLFATTRTITCKK